MFYLVAIFVIMALPLGVPTTVSLFHAISNLRQSTRAVRRATSGAARPVLIPARQGAVVVAA